MILSTHCVSDAKDPVSDFAVEVSADQGLRAVWNSSTDKGVLYSSNEGTGGHWERSSSDSVTVFWCLRDKTAGNRVCKVCSLRRCLLLSQRLILFYCLCCDCIWSCFTAFCCDSVWSCFTAICSDSIWSCCTAVCCDNIRSVMFYCRLL